MNSETPTYFMHSLKENTKLPFLYEINHISCQSIKTFVWNLNYVGCHGKCYLYTLVFTQNYENAIKLHIVHGIHGNNYQLCNIRPTKKIWGNMGYLLQ